MRAARSFLLMVAALLALMSAPTMLAAAIVAPQNITVAIAEPCSSSCADMPGNCGGDCIRCDPAMAGCRASAGCGTVVAVAPTGSVAIKHDPAGTIEIPPPCAALHGRSIKPEVHPPSAPDQQA